MMMMTTSAATTKTTTAKIIFHFLIMNVLIHTQMARTQKGQHANKIIMVIYGTHTKQTQF